jgi:hypothetical protein
VSGFASPVPVSPCANFKATMELRSMPFLKVPLHRSSNEFSEAHLECNRHLHVELPGPERAGSNLNPLRINEHIWLAKRARR